MATGMAELVALSRPLIRGTDPVRKSREGRAEASSCVSCSRCFAAIATGRPARCFRVPES